MVSDCTDMSLRPQGIQCPVEYIQKPEPETRIIMNFSISIDIETVSDMAVPHESCGNPGHDIFIVLETVMTLSRLSIIGSRRFPAYGPGLSKGINSSKRQVILQ